MTPTSIAYVAIIHQDTRSCVVQPSSGVRYTVLFTGTNFQPFSAIYNTKTTGLDFNQNHVIDALKSCYIAYQI